MFKLPSCVVVLLLIVLENNFVTSQWSQFENLEGGVNHVACASWAPGRLDIFGNDNSGQIWHKAFDGYWSGWHSLGGDTTQKPGAFSIKKNWVDVMYTGKDRHLHRRTWNGKVWTDWKTHTNGGIFNSGPALTATPGDINNLHVFVVASDNSLWHCVVTMNDDKWSNWEKLGGGLVGTPAAVSWGSNRFDVFSIAPDYRMWQKTYDYGWKEWTQMPDGKFKPTGVGAASPKHNSITVFGTGMDDAIYKYTFQNGKWGAAEGVGGLIRSSPSAVSTSSTRIDVFGVGRSDARVYRSYWDTYVRVDSDATSL